MTRLQKKKEMILFRSAAEYALLRLKINEKKIRKSIRKIK